LFGSKAQLKQQHIGFADHFSVQLKLDSGYGYLQVFSTRPVQIWG